MLRHVPGFLVGLRFVLAPVVFGLAMVPGLRPWAATCLGVAFLSDVFDGILARRLGVATARLRLADSATDVWLYLWMLAAACAIRGERLWVYRWPLSGLVALQLVSWSIDRVKFGRATALHSYTAKAWGVTLALAGVALLCLADPSPFVATAIGMGFVSNGEDVAIKALLPDWRHDGASVWHAWRIRREFAGGEDR